MYANIVIGRNQGLFRKCFLLVCVETTINLFCSCVRSLQKTRIHSELCKPSYNVSEKTIILHCIFYYLLIVCTIGSGTYLTKEYHHCQFKNHKTMGNSISNVKEQKYLSGTEEILKCLRAILALAEDSGLFSTLTCLHTNIYNKISRVSDFFFWSLQNEHTCYSDIHDGNRVKL